MGWTHARDLLRGNRFYGFIEWGVNRTQQQGRAEFGFDCAPSSQLVAGHYARFKLYHVTGNNGRWYFMYDNNDDGIYECFAGLFTGVTFFSGLAIGETGFTGGTETSAYDHIAGMKYTAQLDDQGWASFPNNAFYQGCLPGYGRHSFANDEWEIHTGYPCPG